MHEFSLVQSLLDQVETIRRAEDAERVVSIRVSVGEFSGADADLLQDAFEIQVQDTPARGATLLVDATPLEAKCLLCAIEFRVSDFRFICPQCQKQRIEVVRGEDIILESVTLEKNGNEPYREETVARTEPQLTS